MSLDEFQKKFESGELPVNSHKHLLHLGYIYTERKSCVFDAVHELHARGWTYGQGDLKFNRTLDVFYLCQIVASMYRSTNQGALLSELEEPLPFETIYAENSDLLHEDVWQEYYSPVFLRQPPSARFYRLPDLKDLPDSDSPLYQPRNKPGDGLRQPYTRMPRWAHHVTLTRCRQPTLSVEEIVSLALSTLRETLARQKAQLGSPAAFAYSETQARYWLAYFRVDRQPLEWGDEYWRANEYGIYVARGLYDVWAWERWYSRERWTASVGDDAPYAAPDLDGTRKSSVRFAGWPDGGIYGEAYDRGWEPEVGSDEEVAFSAAVAVEETKDLDLTGNGLLDRLDYTMRSHILWAIVWTACQQQLDPKDLKDLKDRMVAAGRIDASKAEEWIDQARKVVTPYVQGHEWSELAEDRSRYHQILVENGQLFGRWEIRRLPRMFYFQLKAISKELYRAT